MGNNNNGQQNPKMSGRYAGANNNGNNSGNMSTGTGELHPDLYNMGKTNSSVGKVTGIRWTFLASEIQSELVKYFTDKGLVELNEVFISPEFDQNGAFKTFGIAVTLVVDNKSPRISIIGGGNGNHTTNGNGNRRSMNLAKYMINDRKSGRHTSFKVSNDAYDILARFAILDDDDEIYVADGSVQNRRNRNRNRGNDDIKIAVVFLDFLSVMQYILDIDDDSIYDYKMVRYEPRTSNRNNVVDHSFDFIKEPAPRNMGRNHKRKNSGNTDYDSIMRNMSRVFG